jgi:hypothetical protein
MTQNDEIRDFFARYAAEVGKHLPVRGREDIEREIATTLADRLDDRAGPSGRAPSTEDAVALLKETGHPRKTASSYLTHGYIVGPALFPLFSMVCRIALPVVGAVLICVTTLTAALGSDAAVNVAEHVLRILGSAVTGVLQAFAIIVIVFAALERIDPAQRLKAGIDPWEPWDPRELPKVTHADAIKVSDQIAAIVFGTIFIVFLLFLPRLTDIGVWNAGRIVSKISMSDGFRGILPFIVVSTGADIVAAVFLLTRRVQSTATVAAKAGAKALGIVASGLLLTVWPFVLLEAGAPAGAELGFRVLNQVIRVGCILGIVAGSWDMAREVVRYTRSRRAAA